VAKSVISYAHQTVPLDTDCTILIPSMFDIKKFETTYHCKLPFNSKDEIQRQKEVNKRKEKHTKKGQPNQVGTAGPVRRPRMRTPRPGNEPNPTATLLFPSLFCFF
jgi:hypothetical protein